MSTEEQNHSPAALKDAALKAALAAAAGIPAQPAEDILTGYKTVVAEGVNPPLGLAEAALDLINNDRSFDWLQPPASNPLTLVSNRDDAEMKALEARRQTAISALKDAIANAEGEVRDDLERALERLESAKNPGEIQAALTVAQSTLSREAAGGGSKSAGGEMAEINARHKELYASDPVYRAKVDEITTQATKLMDDSEKRRVDSDAIAKKYGITTDYDKEMAKLAEKYKTLDPTTPEARALEVRMLEMERLQNEARIKELYRLGLVEEAKKLEANRPPIDEARKKAEQLFNEQKDAYLEALRNKLVAEGVPEKKIEEMIAKQRTSYDEELAKAKNVGEILDLQGDIKNDKAGLLQNEKETAEKVVPPDSNYVAKSPEDKTTPGGTFPFQEASVSEAALPQNLPTKKAERTIQQE